METVTKKKNGEAVPIKVSKRKRNIGVGKIKRWVTGNYSQVEARLWAYFNTAGQTGRGSVRFGSGGLGPKPEPALKVRFQAGPEHKH